MGVEALRSRADAKAADLAPIIKELRAAGKTSLSAIAAELNDAGVPTARDGKWSSPQVMRMLERLDPFREEEAAAEAEVSSRLKRPMASVTQASARTALVRRVANEGPG
jgi:hypothetical protein